MDIPIYIFSLSIAASIANFIVPIKLVVDGHFIVHLHANCRYSIYTIVHIYGEHKVDYKPLTVHKYLYTNIELVCRNRVDSKNLNVKIKK